MGIGTFGSFTQARSAIYAAQTGITVTGNNISNINTTGYTRQRLDQGSLYTAGSDRYYSQGDVRIGQGVLVRSLSQIRSPYLDIRYRTEAAKLGYSDAKLDVLDQVASVLDEVGKGDATKEEDGFGILGLEFSKISDALHKLSEQTGHQEYDSTVKQTCDSLTTMLNRYANNLQKVYDNTVTQLHQDVDDINALLTRIREYNQEIRKCDIHGDNALELRDERNVAIDELSKLVGIRVHYSYEEFSPGVEVEKLSIYLDNQNPDGAVDTDSSLLVDGIYASQLILEQVPQPREIDPNKPETWPYQDKDGNPVMTKDKADKIPMPNPKADQTEPNGDDNPLYLDKYGNPTKDANAALMIPAPNKKGVLYLKPDGTPTDNPKEARQVDNPNFNITVSELRSAAGRLLYTNRTAAEVEIGSSLDLNDTTLDADLRKAIEDAAAAIKAGGTTTESRATDFEGIDDIIITTYREKLVANPPYYTSRDPATGRPVGPPTTVNTGIPNPTYYEYFKDEPVLDEHGEPAYEADGTTPKVQRIYSSTKLPGMKENTAENAVNPTTPAYAGRYLTAPLDQGGQPCDAAHAARTYYKTVTTRAASTPVLLDDNDLSGQIQAHREMLTEGGEFTDRSVITKESDVAEGAYRDSDEDAGTKRGIPYYQRRLDLLANTFATLMNEANQGFRMDPDGNYITYGTNEKGETVGVPVTVEYEVDNEDGTGKVKKSIKLNKNTDWAALDQEARDAMVPATSVEEYLKQQKVDENGPVKDENGDPVSNGIFDGGVLFSNNGSGNDTTNITAKNISISYKWQNTENLIVRSYTCPWFDTEPASGDPDNINHIKDIVSGKRHDFVPSSLDATGVTKNASSDIMFTGTFYEFWNNMGSVLGHDQELTGKELDTAYQNSLEIDTSRDSVSAVDFNDEAMNLMMYAKSYNAACRLMTTIDSVLDKLINNTGLTT